MIARLMILEPAVVLRIGTGFFVVAFFLYWLPTLIAIVRSHHQIGPIVVINFLLGWTLIGWVAALAWSVSHIPERSA